MGLFIVTFLAYCLRNSLYIHIVLLVSVMFHCQGQLEDKNPVASSPLSNDGCMSWPPSDGSDEVVGLMCSSLGCGSGLGWEADTAL